jgi:hypothetical protein
MGIHWVAAIFFAAQAAPLAWRGSHADCQNFMVLVPWFICTGEYKPNLLFSHH